MAGRVAVVLFGVEKTIKTSIIGDGWQSYHMKIRNGTDCIIVGGALKKLICPTQSNAFPVGVWLVVVFEFQLIPPHPSKCFWPLPIWHLFCVPSSSLSLWPLIRLHARQLPNFHECIVKSLFLKKQLEHF